MRRKTQRKLSPLQKSRLRRVCILLGTTAFLWLLFAPGSGLFSLLRQRSELRELQLQAENLRKENAKLQKEIEQLENDPAYLEEIARRDYGLLKEHEHVYDFSKPEQSKKKK